MKFVYEHVKLRRVIDGDTQEFSLDLGFGTYKLTSIRLQGCDTPETRTKNKLEKQAGLKVKKYVKDLLAKYTNDDLTVISKGVKDKYAGRAVGDVMIENMSLTEMLLVKKYAHKYDGKTKQAWTNEELQYMLDN